jgi:hypothetical protein
MFTFVLLLVFVCITVLCISHSNHLSRCLQQCRKAMFENEGALYATLYELQSENFYMRWKLRTWEAYAKGEILGIAGYCIPADKLSLTDMHYLLTVKGNDAFLTFIRDKVESYLNDEAKA